MPKLQNWFTSNKLSLNIEKTKYVLFELKPTHCSFNIKLNDNNIMKTDSVKYLGMTLQNNLK